MLEKIGHTICYKSQGTALVKKSLVRTHHDLGKIGQHVLDEIGYIIG